MMHIIILEGDKGKGKTQTIQMVFGLLQILNANLHSITILPNTNNKDFEAELLYQNKKVAIYSKGDNQTDCYNTITKYENKKYDVLIIAHSSIHSALTINSNLFTSTLFNKRTTSTQTDEMRENLKDCLNIFINI